jgi:hypothetical protein
MLPETTPWGHAVWLAPDLDNRCAVAHMPPLRYDDGGLTLQTEVKTQ